MIERKFVEEKVKESRIKKFLEKEISRCGYSNSELQRTPLGIKIIIWSSKPGLIVSKEGRKIKSLQKALEEEFKLENLQIEIREIENPDLDPQIMAEKIATQLEKLEANKFKAIGHKSLQRILDSGARGAEILISGKVPSQRAKSWRFRMGYLPKCGDVTKMVLVGFKIANPRPGIIGIKVSILPKDAKMPDEISIRQEKKAEEKNEKKGD